MVLSTHVKYAPFATRKRKGYMRDASERDLSVHLETALRGAIITDKWPKSGVDVVVTIIEDDLPQQETLEDDVEVWEMMTVLSGCITVASAAIVDAGIDCVDTVTGGVAALVASDSPDGGAFVVVDPVIAEHQVIYAACCVAYLPKRDEITNLWYRGSPPPVHPTRRHSLIAGAIFASKCAVKAVIASLSEPQSLV
ncbi:3' exoribonuclease [Moelleriella libera RCEF 2490]|uniref:3' exoribonuclease n=1 Tax=Moelleriella libera RCEF 2490 TaxID=1081109 RepID=A0A166RSI1_9HYPO|nr:3' exoribonuclease [Moelleriella libera RCEF 2490]